MIYTQEQLEVMSDFKINLTLTEVINKESYNKWAVTADETAVYHCGFDGSQHHFVDIADYCNNWEDMGPLANQAGIGSVLTFSGWNAFYFDDDGDNTCANFDCTHKNELRAKAIVYILIKQGE